jgi:single-stranded DNA-binding protein
MSYQNNNGGMQQAPQYGYPQAQGQYPPAQPQYGAPQGQPAYGYPQQQMQGYPQQGVYPQQQGQPAPAPQQPAAPQNGQQQGRQFITYGHFTNAVTSDGKPFIYVDFECAVTRCSQMKYTSEGKPYINFSMPIQGRQNTLDRVFGQGTLVSNDKGVVWVNCSMWEKVAERFLNMVATGRHNNPVLIISGSAKIHEYERNDGTPAKSLNITVSDFTLLRDRNSGSCMDPNAQQQAPQGYQSSFGAPAANGYQQPAPQQAPQGGYAPQQQGQQPMNYGQPAPNGFYELNGIDDSDLPF